MKIVNVIGGLGNQMLQCAFAIALSKQYPTEAVKIDISHFKGYGLHNGFEVLEIFKKYPISIATKEECKKLTSYIPNYKLSRLYRRIFPKRKTEYLQSYKDSYVYDPRVMTVSGNCYFEGYWMSNKYFEPYKEDILKAFEFGNFKTQENKKYAKLLSKDNSVSIHIRRGDYIKAKNFMNICTLDYYRKAIREARKYIENPVFFIFSNDQEWCLENLNDVFEDYEVYFIDHNKGSESFHDMQLMSLARCNILANSSFSWWGAYLNNRQNHITIVPSRWTNNISDQDVFVENWIKI